MATKNSKNKAGKNNILKNPVVIVLAFIAMTVLILASSFYTAQKNKVDITQIVLNGNIQLAVGENQAVGFNVATPKVMDNDLVVNAVNKLDLVWTVEDEKVATYDEDQLMYGDKEADYAKLLSLFGKEYASTADVVSGLYRRMADPTAKLPFKYIKDTWAVTLAMLRFSLSIFWQALKATCRRIGNPLRDLVKCSRKSIRRGRTPARCRTSRRFS